MKWNEFKMLLGGVMPETPLGRIAAIRSEDDKNILKHFTKEQKRIHDEWNKKQMKEISQANIDDMLEQLKVAFIHMGRGDINEFEQRRGSCT